MSRDVKTPAHIKCCVFLKMHPYSSALKRQLEWQEMMRKLNKKGPWCAGTTAQLVIKRVCIILFDKTNKQRTCKFGLCLCLQPVAF